MIQNLGKKLVCANYIRDAFLLFHSPVSRNHLEKRLVSIGRTYKTT